MRSVVLYGAAEIGQMTPEMHWKIIRQYYETDEETQAYLDQAPPESESAWVRVKIEKIVSWDFNG